MNPTNIARISATPTAAAPAIKGIDSVFLGLEEVKMVAEDVVAAADVIVAADVDEGGKMAGEDVIAETDIIVAADVDADVKGKGGELVRAAALLLAALDVTRKEIATTAGFNARVIRIIENHWGVSNIHVKDMRAIRNISLRIRKDIVWLTTGGPFMLKSPPASGTESRMKLQWTGVERFAASRNGEVYVDRVPALIIRIRRHRHRQRENNKGIPLNLNLSPLSCVPPKLPPLFSNAENVPIAECAGTAVQALIVVDQRIGVVDGVVLWDCKNCAGERQRKEPQEIHSGVK
ncbi:hypothetical protein B0H14DRAFT_2636713 [Mycena olivaceomarginata]|nr:hypothetical protein B0H14DRAFT_2636713 [Mycena olivaceomarginata]